ncbi:hypothetical protein Poly24_41630 [Rosistilla carotiformis]|uniref:Uncharacterized protein n=1 Tax=Rosistilla carotiformis TaxID=2528017 RepID=A0A518JY21_9BACT|nr:hypothetical protein Poly24_41630 [Rosistilla carotiformis]
MHVASRVPILAAPNSIFPFQQRINATTTIGASQNVERYSTSIATYGATPGPYGCAVPAMPWANIWKKL